MSMKQAEAFSFESRNLMYTSTWLHKFSEALQNTAFLCESEALGNRRSRLVAPSASVRKLFISSPYRPSVPVRFGPVLLRFLLSIMLHIGCCIDTEFISCSTSKALVERQGEVATLNQEKAHLQEELNSQCFIQCKLTYGRIAADPPFQSWDRTSTSSAKRTLPRWKDWMRTFLFGTTPSINYHARSVRRCFSGVMSVFRQPFATL